MKYDLYFILNYWKIHWRKALLILLSYILMTIFVFSAFSMVRTELRRTYYDNYTSRSSSIYIPNGCGGYNTIIKGLSEKDASELEAEERVTQSARVYTSCYMGNDEFSYTYGAYENDTAYELSGIRLKNGSFPSKRGETAISELALSNMRIDAEVGDTITLCQYDSERNYAGEGQYLLTGIFEDDGTRDGWETCSTRFISVFEPVILLFLEDIDIPSSVLSVMYREKSGDRLGRILTGEEENEHLLWLESYLSKAENGCSQGAYDSSYFTAVSGVGLNVYSYDGAIITAKSNFYRYICAAAAVVMAISLVCSLLVIMPQKLRSMKMMYKIGYPSWRLKRMMLLEWLMFTAAGLILGFVFAVICYELLLQLQSNVFGLDIYHAWDAVTEWGIKQVTYSPELSAVLFVAVSSVIAFGIPTVFLKRLMFKQNKKIKKHSASSDVKFGKGMRKIFRQPVIGGLQIISLVTVLAVGCTSMMFFSTNGKSSFENPQILAQGQIFETNLKLDMRQYNIDCTIENGDLSGLVGLLDTSDMECGLGTVKAEKLSNSDKIDTCYAWSEIYNLFGCYPQGSDVPKEMSLHNQDFFAPGEITWYGLDDYDIYDIKSALIMNDSMLEKLGADVKAMDSGKAAVISLTSKKIFEDVQSISLFTAIGKPNTDMQFAYEILGSKIFDAEITEVVDVNDEPEETDPLLYNIINKLSNSYILVFSAKGAKELGLYNKNFDHVYLQYSGGTRDVDIRSILSDVNFSKSKLELTTITQQQNRYDVIMLKEYVVVFTVFLMFLLMALIGYIQTLKLQIGQRKSQIKILRAIGTSRKKLCGSITLQLMKIPLLSCILGAAATALLKAFFKQRYDICQGLREIANNEGNNASEIYIDAMTQYSEQAERFLTKYEMWKVSVIGVFAVLAVVIAAVIFLFLRRISAKAVKSDIITGGEE